MAKKLTQNVNKDKFLNDLPKVVPESSRWLNQFANYTSCNVGDIYPIYYKEVLPKEKKKLTMSMISHTSTPLAPIFNSLYTELRAFVVPIRLCADLLNGYKTRKSPWVKVFGEDNANANSTVIVPLAQQKLPTFTTSHHFITDLGYAITHGLKTDNVLDALDLLTANNTSSELAEQNYLALAAYELIYQRHYRNENYEAATSSNLYRLLFDAYNSSRSYVQIGNLSFEKASREKDYFTGMKPFTQKGDAIHVSVGDSAPIKVASSVHSMGGQVKFGSSAAGSNQDSLQGNLNVKSGGVQSNTTSIDSSLYTIDRSNLVADLSSAQGISIEELRLLIKTQELLEKDAVYGSLYAESLNAHFGTCPFDETLQDPQELYKTTITSQMQAIFQTSATANEDTILGTIGANSTTQTDPFIILPETEFKEHSILMICAVHKVQNVYNSKYFKPKFNFKNSRFDFYTPELNDMGFQPVTNQEMRSSSNAVAGYNEAFAEYRYSFNSIHGSLAASFPYWAPAIGSEYSSAAALYKEDPIILDKALSVYSTTAPQFYDAWGFEEDNTKPMSLHSIPGMDGVI